MNDSSRSSEELREPATHYNGSLDLDLPDGTGFISRPPRLDPDAYMYWCEELMKLGYAKGPSPAHCTAEFNL